MEVLILLIIISVGLASIFLFAFVVSVKNKQFDDLYSPSIRILFEKSSKKIATNIKQAEDNADKMLDI